MPSTSKRRPIKRHKNAESARQQLSWIEYTAATLMNARYLPGLTIVVAILVAYSNALTGPFLFDDSVTIEKNDSIQSLWPLNQALWAPVESSTAGRPIPNFTFALNYSIHGFNVVGYHFANIAVHILNVLLVFFLSSRILTSILSKEHPGGHPLRSQKNSLRTPSQGHGGARLIAWTIAILWGLHPLHSETVCYVTQRTELLMGLFFLLTIYTACRAWDASDRFQKVGWELLSIACCACGMASKEVMVVAPVIVILFDSAFGGESFVGQLRKRGFLYLGLLATWVILALLLSSNPRGNTVGFGLSVHPFDYFTTQLWAITHYLRLAIWPSGLCGDYGIGLITDMPTWLPCLFFLLFLAGLTIWAWKRDRRLSFLGAWFFVILSPTSSFIPILSEPIAERRMYLPLLAFVVLAVFVGLTLIRRWLKNPPLPANATGIDRRWILGVTVLILAGVYGRTTYVRNSVFRSEQAFWKDVVAKRPLNARGYLNLGIAYQHDNQLELAMVHFERAVELDPSDPETLYNLGAWQAMLGQPNKALTLYDQAIALNPNMTEALFNRAILLQQLGRLENAIVDYQAVIDLQPDLVGAHFNLGHLYFTQKRFREAIPEFKSVLRLEPTNSDAQKLLQECLP